MLPYIQNVDMRTKYFSIIFIWIRTVSGREITYTVREEQVADYTVTYSAPASAGGAYTLTNTYTPGKTSVTVTKQWLGENGKTQAANVTKL